MMLYNYYSSRIFENYNYEMKPWYYKALLHILERKWRFRPYNPKKSNIPISQIIRKEFSKSSFIENEIFISHYFWEMWIVLKDTVKPNEPVFKSDKERIECLEQVLRMPR